MVCSHCGKRGHTAARCPHLRLDKSDYASYAAKSYAENMVISMLPPQLAAAASAAKIGRGIYKTYEYEDAAEHSKSKAERKYYRAKSKLEGFGSLYDIYQG